MSKPLSCKKCGKTATLHQFEPFILLKCLECKIIFRPKDAKGYK